MNAETTKTESFEAGPFSEGDWEAYCGAEGWGEDEPVARNISNIHYAVADKTGIEVVLFIDDDDVDAYALNMPLTCQQHAIWFLNGIEDDVTAEQLLSAGFEAI